MKSVESVTLFLMMMMFFVSAGPLPPSLNKSRHDDQNTTRLHLLSDQEETSSRNVTSNMTMIETLLLSRPVMMNLFPDELNTYHRNCVLSTCLTANLGSALQGGDETAGRITTDPFGIGKK